MPQSKRKRSTRKKPQRYDTSFKRWVEQRANDILPLLLEGTVYEATVNVETARSMVRADKVFKIMYYGKEHILHIEFETGLDAQLSSRLLLYNAALHRDHQLPVITIVVYPFRVQQAMSPLRIISSREEILTFHFRTLPLFAMEAEQFVRAHRACMYPILPTMQGVHAELLAQVMQELTELYRDDETTLAQQYEWMMIFLERTDTIQPLEKAKIEERLSMYDKLFEESARVKKTREQAKAESEVKTFRQALLSVVQARFPDLSEFAQKQVELFDKPDALDLLIQRIAVAPDANIVRWLLGSSPEAPQ